MEASKTSNTGTGLGEPASPKLLAGLALVVVTRDSLGAVPGQSEILPKGNIWKKRHQYSGARLWGLFLKRVILCCSRCWAEEERASVTLALRDRLCEPIFLQAVAL